MLVDSVVTARVPVEIKKQATEVLASIGATQTQLINAAYEYVLEYKALPEKSVMRTIQHKALPLDRVQTLRAILDRTTFSVSEEYWQDKSYEDLIAEGKIADYEALT